jgi:hypothetical protein
MRKLLIPLVVGLTILVTQVVTGVSAQTPGYTNDEVSIPYVAFTEPPTAEPTDAAVDGCWDCPGTTMTEAEKLAAACSPAMLATFPQHLDLCFPDKWEWVCFPDGHCEMYRQDLDPLGIFATPAPMPTPEPLPTPELTPEPTPTVVPTPEATDTVVAP